MLGSIVSEQGILPDPDKIAAVNQLPAPRNVAQARSFLGATGYFHDHIQGYATKSAPLRALLEKSAVFTWTSECQGAFDGLKADLVSPQCLRMFHCRRPFILITDRSEVAVGALLSQHQPIDPDDPQSEEKRFVIACASRGLTSAESNYAPTEGECLTLVWATRKFRQFLHGCRFHRFPSWFISRCARLSRTSVLTGFQVYILQGCRDTWNRMCVAAKCIPSSQALAVVYNAHSINGPRHESSPRYCRVESNHDEQAWYFSTEKVGEGRRMHNPFTTHCRTQKKVPCVPRTGD